MRDQGPWQNTLAQGVRDLSGLVERGLITVDEASRLEDVTRQHRVFVSDYYLELIDPNDPHCPIRAQAIPSALEAVHHSEADLDPIGDDAHRVNEVLIHRYPNRVLLLPTHVCPMYCRYCFRKVAINSGPIRLHQALGPALAYVEATPSINEVILSGGDPLMLSDRLLGKLLDQINKITHVRRVRLHTRTPVTFPHRITPALVHLLSAVRAVTVVTHVNHPREISPHVIDGLMMFRRAGITLANQSVLLKGVNDNVDTLTTLCEELSGLGVRPYYLHHLDAAPGTQHFRVSLARGLEVYHGLCQRLSGLDRPSYMLEIPGGGGKVRADSSAVFALPSPGTYRLTSPLDGSQTVWRDPATVVSR